MRIYRNSNDGVHYWWLRLRRDQGPVVGLRVGKAWPFFSERYQGTRGIPRRYVYLFTRRVTLIRPRGGWPPMGLFS